MVLREELVIEEQVEVQGGQDTLTEAILGSIFKYDHEVQCLAYKKVMNKVCPVSATMSKGFCIICHFSEDSLAILPTLSTSPPSFQPGNCLTQARMNTLGLFKNDFLWLEEQKLIIQVLLNNKIGLAWDKSEKGHFWEDYFAPVKIPVVKHIPWTRKSLAVPPGIYDKVIALIKQKIESGIYELSYSSYCHQWFTVAKKNGDIHIIHNLMPLNAVTISNSQSPPLVYLYAEQCSA
ncbi:hypothetical protein AN958_05797 [Leucoagaricus sp. SymC.cos]|nr:hypothetical protein AN958_05797 [Leucoagaricus sp. SymC.cos]